jgi:hypothetical protein
MTKNGISKEREKRIHEQLKSIPEKDYKILYEEFKKGNVLDKNNLLIVNDLDFDNVEELENILEETLQTMNKNDQEKLYDDFTKLQNLNKADIDLIFKQVKNEKLFPLNILQSKEFEVDLETLPIQTAKRIQELVTEKLSKSTQITLLKFNFNRWKKDVYSSKPLNSKLFEILFANGKDGDPEMRTNQGAGRMFVTKRFINFEEIPFCFNVNLRKPYSGKMIIEGFFNSAGKEPVNFGNFPVSKQDSGKTGNFGLFHKVLIRQGEMEFDVTTDSCYELKSFGSAMGKSVDKKKPMIILIHFIVNMNKFLSNEKASSKSKSIVFDKMTLFCEIDKNGNIAETELFSFFPLVLFKSNSSQSFGQGDECVSGEDNREERTKKVLSQEQKERKKMQKLEDKVDEMFDDLIEQVQRGKILPKKVQQLIDKQIRKNNGQEKKVMLKNFLNKAALIAQKTQENQQNRKLNLYNFESESDTESVSSKSSFNSTSTSTSSSSTFSRGSSSNESNLSSSDSD